MRPVLLATLLAGAAATHSLAADLPSNVVARIGNVDIPYNWFLHTFRSTFFQYGEGDAVRRQVFDDFMERMTAYAAARSEGFDQDPALRAAIDRRVSDLRAYMEYQLAMAEVEMLLEAFLERHELGLDRFRVPDNDLQLHMELQMAAHPDTPAVPHEEIPLETKEEVRRQLQAERQLEAIQALVRELRSNTVVQVNDPLVDHVPFPTVVRDSPP